jgi:hypothetical protein
MPVRCIGLLLFALAAGAAEPVSATPGAWDWLPVAVEVGDAVHASYRSGADAVAQAAVPATPGTVPVGPASLVVLAPGQGAGLVRARDGGLLHGGLPAVLLTPRIAPVTDRRWRLLGAGDRTPAPRPCPHRIAAASVLDLAVAAQAVAPAGTGVVVVIGAQTDGVDHRSWSLVLTWVVADLVARGAAQVVLVAPALPSPLAGQIAPLRGLVQQVAERTGAIAVDSRHLDDPVCWATPAPGILGTGLNDHGRLRLDELLAPWAH